mmetsp:Transcript_3057/g.5731  ORF Transcript_3057/g.5731 Transcript_3057/m.5731 type:complete len:331 (+) Transcript_3057:80-1072(+)
MDVVVMNIHVPAPGCYRPSRVRGQENFNSIDDDTEEGREQHHKEYCAAELAPLRVLLQRLLLLLTRREEVEQDEGEQWEDGRQEGELPEPSQLVVFEGLVAAVPYLAQTVRDGRGDDQGNVPERREHAIRRPLRPLRAKRHVHDARGEELDSPEELLQDIVAHGEGVVGYPDVGVPLEDQDQLHAGKERRQDARDDVDGSPRRAEEVLLVAHDAEERHHAPHQRHEPNEPGRELESKLQVTVPRHVRRLQHVVAVDERHGFPHGLELNHIPNIMYLVLDSLRLPLKLVKKRHARHQNRQRHRRAYRANLRERQPPTPALLVVNRAAGEGA